MFICRNRFLFVHKFFGTNPGHHTVTSFTKPGPAILTLPISFAPCLLISIIKSTQVTILVIFIHQSFLQYISFHSIRAIQRETERNSGLGSSWSSFCGILSLISQLIYDDIDVAQGVAFLTNFRIICNHNKNIQYPYL